MSMRSTLLLLLLLPLAACAAPRDINSDDLAAIRTGRRCLILLRIAPTPDLPADAYKHILPTGALLFAYGNFNSGGATSTLLFPIRLSSQSLAEGWLCFLLPPEDYYLAFDSSDRVFTYQVPHWHLAIPGNAPVIYAGTFTCPGQSHRDLWTTYYTLDASQATLSDESSAARTLLSSTLPQLPPAQTLLLQPQETGPLHLHAPVLSDKSHPAN